MNEMNLSQTNQSPPKRPQIILTKSIGKSDAKVELINYKVPINSENRKTNQEVIDRELDLAAQAAEQLNKLSGEEENEQP